MELSAHARVRARLGGAAARGIAERCAALRQVNSSRGDFLHAHPRTGGVEAASWGLSSLCARSQLSPPFSDDVFFSSAVNGSGDATSVSDDAGNTPWLTARVITERDAAVCSAREGPRVGGATWHQLVQKLRRDDKSCRAEGSRMHREQSIRPPVRHSPGPGKSRAARGAHAVYGSQ